MNENENIELDFDTTHYLNSSINDDTFKRDLPEPYLQRFFNLKINEFNIENDLYFETFKQQIIKLYQTEFKPIIKYVTQNEYEFYYFDFSEEQEKALLKLSTEEFKMLIVIFNYDCLGKNPYIIDKKFYKESLGNLAIKNLKNELEGYIKEKTKIFSEQYKDLFNEIFKLYSESYQLYFNRMNGTGEYFLLAKLTELQIKNNK